MALKATTPWHARCCNHNWRGRGCWCSGAGDDARRNLGPPCSAIHKARLNGGASGGGQHARWHRSAHGRYRRGNLKVWCGQVPH